jgi:Protein of unknown function (DUF1236)
MICNVRHVAIALAFVVSTFLVGRADARDSGPDNAASPPSDSQATGLKKLSPAQRETIFVLIRRGNVSIKRPPSNVSVAVGAHIPSSTELYSMPQAATDKVPDAKGYVYTIVNGILVLVDPASRKVVATARQ